jgi:hypothetical protein
MDRQSQLIKSIRYILADMDGDRWSDEFLQSLINEALEDLVYKTRMLRAKKIYYLDENVEPVFQLPEDLLLLDRVLYRGKVLSLIPRYKLDEQKPDWELDKGHIEAIVYDKLNKGYIRFYPIPNDIKRNILFQYKEAISLDQEAFDFNQASGEIVNMKDSDINSPYGFVTDVAFYDLVYDNDKCVKMEILPTDINNEFGIVGDIRSLMYDIIIRDGKTNGVIVDGDISLSSPYGVTVDLEVDKEDKTYYNSIYGILTNGNIIEDYIDVYYIKKAESLNEIDSIWDKAIKFYVAGMALRYDADAQNVARGNEYLQLYANELAQAKKMDMRDFTRTSTASKYEIQYKGFI